jgi:uncharacterized protein
VNHFILSLLIVVSFAANVGAAEPAAAKVLILTGNDYPGHKWKETSPVLADVLRKDQRLQVTVQEDPKFLADPKLNDYDVIVLHYMNWESPDPGDAARENLRKFVAGGKGLVLVHFACGAFKDWPEFVNIVGRIYDPKLPPHDPYGKFTVDIADQDHPITKGMKPFETVDELYTCLAENSNKIGILATAKSKVTGKDHPMGFVLNYGKGRVYHSVLGHDVKAFAAEGVGELYRRACAWAAGMAPTNTK